MTVTVYHYPKCSTCKKAIAWLREHDVPMKLVDIVEAPPSAEALARIAEQADRPAAKMFNTAGQSYRAGGYKDHVASMSDHEIFAALAADGKLIKRPVAVSGDVAVVGFDEDSYRRAWG